MSVDRADGRVRLEPSLSRWPEHDAPDSDEIENEVDDIPLTTERGFARFARGFEKIARGFFLARGVAPDDADDLCQELFLTLWRNRERIVPGKAPAFAVGVARRLLLTHRRKSHLRRIPDLEEIWKALNRGPASHGSHSGGEGGFPSASKTQRLRDALKDGLAALSPRQREVTEGIWLEDLSRPETARRLGLTQGAVRSHERRALSRLEHALRRGRCDAPAEGEKAAPPINTANPVIDDVG